MDKMFCKDCKKEGMPNDAGNCPDCGKPMEPMTKKSMNLSTAKSVGSLVPEDQLAATLAVKFVAPDKIFHYVYLWGDSKRTDLEREYFTKSSNFWDDILGHNPRPLTWDHAQDETMKSSPIIGKTTDFGDDEVGRWAISHLDRAHRYRKAVDAMIEEGVIGTSSDSAAQYVERVEDGKSAWLKTWPWFASALTEVPCEHRMVGTVEHFKSLGLEFPIPEAPVSQVRAMVQKAHRIFEFSRVFGE